MMLKPLFWVAVGAAGALQLDKWLSERKSRFTPHAMTGALLDKVNQRLETRTTTAASAPADPRLQ